MPEAIKPHTRGAASSHNHTGICMLLHEPAGPDLADALAGDAELRADLPVGAAVLTENDDAALCIQATGLTELMPLHSSSNHTTFRKSLQERALDKTLTVW